MLDLSEPGGQIAEKLFVLLDAEQQHGLIQYVLDRIEQENALAGIPLAAPKNLLQMEPAPPLTKIHEGDLYICLEERKVCVGGQEIELTAKEFDALYLLAVNRKRVLTFDTISYQVWGEGYDEVTTQAIHNLMSRLRQKIQILPDMPEYIVSVRGVGYKFDVKSCNSQI